VLQIAYCADSRCSHLLAIGGDGWPMIVGYSDIEPRLQQARCRLAAGFQFGTGSRCRSWPIANR
jgi:hypothetical protein